MTVRKISWLCILCLVVAEASAQCDCNQITSEQKLNKLYDDTQAQSFVKTYSGLFRRPATIYARPYACDGKSVIYSRICETGDRKYIFYKEEFLDGLLAQSKWGDQFVLAHEIAHHLLGHTERAYRLERVQDSLDRQLRNKTYEAKNSRGNRNQYTVSIPLRHLHELEADALALWMVVQRKATRSDMQEIFKVLPKLLSVYSHTRSFDPTVSTESHPSLFIRKQLIDRHWERYQKPDFVKRYAAIDEADNYKSLEKDTEEFYAFQLLTADREQQEEFNAVERDIRDSLSRRSRFFVDLMLGGMMQRPMLRRAGDPVTATDSRSLTAGLRFGIGPWYRRSRFETDLKIGGSNFTTQAMFADGLRTVEEFSTTYLYVQPRYVYSRISRLAASAYRASGLMATAGASVSIPVQYAYKNYVASPAPDATQRPGFAPVVGLGYGISNWHNGNGHFRWWLLYQPQPLRFVTPDKVTAWLHTVSLDFSFRFW